MELEKDNEYMDFDFCPFIIKEFSDSKIMFKLVPKKQGVFKLESIKFMMLDIPKQFHFTTLQNNNQNYNSKFTSVKGL